MAASDGAYRGSLQPLANGAGSVVVDQIPAGSSGPGADALTQDRLEQRRRGGIVRRRGRLVRRALALADLAGISLAFACVVTVTGGATWVAYLVFLLTLPGWVVLATLYGLYDHDEERAYHTTVDDLVGVFNFVTVGVWLTLGIAWAAGGAHDGLQRFPVFWALAIAFVTAGRVVARASCRRSLTYLQNTVVVGAGEVGQLLARKVIRHPEYGMNLVGFVDAEPLERHPTLANVPILGSPDDLAEIVRQHDVERVVIAFSRESTAATLALLRSLKDRNLQIDIVPRLFDLVGPNVDLHTIEGVPIIGLPQVRLSRRSKLLKRTIDLVGASLLLVLTTPLFAVIAARIKRDSPGPVFFRQSRLTTSMREFRVFKFRTMKVGTSPEAHREYIKASMDPKSAQAANGLYKADQDDRVTTVGRWLRRTSLDELPQLINVVRGEMSLVGPRPVPAYETQYYAPHHFERFLVPAGMTGLWQVTARAHATWSEALDMDAAYARGWSLGLDLRLLLHTPRQAFFRNGTA